MEQLKVTFKDWDCVVMFSTYRADDSLAIQLIDAEDGGRHRTASLCMHPDIEQPENCVFIKDYSENEGMTQALVEGGVIHGGPVKTVQTGFVEVSAYQLTPQALKLAGVIDDLEVGNEKPTRPSPGM